MYEHECTRKANTCTCHEPMYVCSYQLCMQALHQGGYGYYVYVFLGNVMEIFYYRSVLRFLKFSLLRSKYIAIAS